MRAVVWGMIEGYDSPCVLQINAKDEADARDMWAERFMADDKEEDCALVMGEENFRQCFRMLAPFLNPGQSNDLMSGA